VRKSKRSTAGKHSERLIESCDFLEEETAAQVELLIEESMAAVEEGLKDPTCIADLVGRPDRDRYEAAIQSELQSLVENNVYD
jgi:hypothetical protein